MELSSDDVAVPYISAVDSLLWARRHCIFDELENLDVPMLEIDGIPNSLTWPLDSDDRDELCDLYHGDEVNCVIIPASQLTFQEDPYAPFTWDIAQYIGDEMRPNGAFTIELSHLVIDGNPSSSSIHLYPRNPSEQSFGTLIIAIPNVDGHCGGNIIVSDELGNTKTWSTSSNSSSSWSFCAFFNSNYVSVNPIQYGFRTLLVYDLIYTTPLAHIPSSLNRIDSITALQAAGQMSNQYYSYIVHSLEHSYSNMSFNTLRSTDATLVEALVQAQDFDIALVQIALATDMIQTYHDREAIVNVIFHPSNDIPSCVKEAFSTAPLLGLNLNPIVSSVHQNRFRLVFWPKKHRVRLLGFRQALNNLKLLQSEPQAIAPLLNYYHSIEDLITATMEMFGNSSVREHDVGFDSPQADLFGSFLVSLGRVDLLVKFIGDYFDFSDSFYFPIYVKWLYSILSQIGWEIMLPAFLQLFKRCNTWNSAVKSVELLANLSGVLRSNEQICPALNQPRASEFIRLCWDQLLHAIWNLDDAEQIMFASTKPSTILELGFLIENGLSSMGNLTEVMLSKNQLINSSLTSANLGGLIQRFPKKFHPIASMAIAIDQLLLRDSSYKIQLKPWLEYIWSFCTPGTPCSVVTDSAAISALLNISIMNDKLDMVLSDGPWIMGKYLLPPLLHIIHSGTLVNPAQIESAIQNSFDEAVDSNNSDGTDNYGDLPTLLNQECSIMSAMLDIIMAFNIPGGLDKWKQFLQQASNMNDAFHYALYVVTPMYSVVKTKYPEFTDLGQWLAFQALDPLRRHIDMQQQDSLSLLDIKLPCACMQCHEIQTFLYDGNRFQFKANHRDLCRVFLNFQNSSSKLCLKRTQDDYIVIEKVNYRVVHQLQLAMNAIAKMSEEAEERIFKKARLSS